MKANKQSGPQKPSQETLNQWHKDPNNWKWGMFYFNRKDKRVFPPKRVSMLGWTVNFANPLSVLIFSGAIALAILVSKLSKQH